MTPDPDLLIFWIKAYTIKQVAEKFEISEDTVTKLITEGHLRATTRTVK